MTRLASPAVMVAVSVLFSTSGDIHFQSTVAVGTEIALESVSIFLR